MTADNSRMPRQPISPTDDVTADFDDVIHTEKPPTASAHSSTSGRHEAEERNENDSVCLDSDEGDSTGHESIAQLLVCFVGFITQLAVIGLRHFVGKMAQSGGWGLKLIILRTTVPDYLLDSELTMQLIRN